jgi:hypothetical protein
LNLTSIIAGAQRRLGSSQFELTVIEEWIISIIAAA